jgi:protein-glutamine gamma-glutamyltransferase
MNLPPFLLGLAVLLWGWQTSAWIFVLFAIPLGVILEARHFVPWRWEVSDKNLHRIVGFCWRMVAVGFAYLLIMQRSFGLIYIFVQYLPAAFASLAIVQAFGNRETVVLSDLFPKIKLFNFKSSSPQPSQSSVLPTSRLKSRTFLFSHVQAAYVLLCLFASSATSRPDTNFYFFMTGLSVWLLWAKRPRRTSRLAWVGLMVLIVSLGFAGHMGLHQLQAKVDQQANQWLQQSGQEVDPFHAHTSLGTLGELKQSNNIFFRVAAADPRLFPMLLRDASYNLYRSSTWIAQKPQFMLVEQLQDGQTWQLAERLPEELGKAKPLAPVSALTITTDLRGGRGLLSLPDGSQQLRHLPVNEVERNQYGAVKVSGQPGSVAYQVTFDPQKTWDSPPTEADLEIPNIEHPAITQVIQQLQLQGKPPQVVMDRLATFFQTNFTYSLKLSNPPGFSTPLTAFLLKNRTGHCEYFATATVLLLREAGIPARYATGYSVHEYSNVEGQYVVRGRNAHAWTMVYLQDHWQALDTTPAAWVELEDRAAPFWQSALDVWSWLTLKLATGFSQLVNHHAFQLVGGVIVLGLVPFQWWLRSLWRRKQTMPKAKLGKSLPKLTQVGHDSEFYRIEQALARTGCYRRPDEPLQSWLQRLQIILPAQQFTDLQVILDLHYRYRFDPEGLTSAERDRLTTLSRDWLRELAIATKGG